LTGWLVDDELCTLTRADDENEADVSDEDVEEVPDPRPTSRSTSRSIPPPVPVDVRIKRTATQVSPPAVADNFRAQANELAEILSTTPDPQIAAELSYELGEIWTRVSDQPQAIAMFTRALELDPEFMPARWALHRTLYRDRSWLQLGETIARALGRNSGSKQRTSHLLATIRSLPAAT